MLNTFPMAGFAVPVPNGITHIYNDTKLLGGDLIAGDLILTDTTISTGGYRIYCKSLTMKGSTLQNNGSNGSTATGGAGGVASTLGAGGAGGTWSVSNVAPSDLSYAALGGNGGRGGDGTAESGLAGGVCSFNPTGSEILGSTFSSTIFSHGFQMGLNSSTHVLTPRIVRGGGGGGQGGKPQVGSGNGGGGGGGGGVVLICCSGDISMNQSRIEAIGGNGANGSTTPPYTSGGGGGGGGGGVLIRCNSLFIKGLSNYGIIVRGGVAGITASSSGAGSYGNIYINTATNAYHYTGGDLGAGSDIALA